MVYRKRFNKHRVIVFHQFGNKGWSLFSCLGREVVCSVLSVSTLTYASAESVSTHPVTTDTVAVSTAREVMLDEVSVTGSRAPLTKSQAARMVTVLERADIQQAPVQSVNDLLKYAVGVDVRQRGPIGTQTDITIRGGTQEQIIILLNGINICDPQTGHNAMDLPVDLNDIVRIEVIEGPAGRIYGTSSLVGAINIVTSPDGGRLVEGGGRNAQALNIRIEGGSYGYANIGFRYSPSSLHQMPSTSSSFGGIKGSLSASYARSDGYSRAKSGTLNTDFSGTKAFYQGGYTDGGTRLYWHLGLSDKGWGSSTFYASPKWQADDQYEHTTKLFSAIKAETRCGRLLLGGNVYWNENRDRYEGYRGQPNKMKYNYNRTDIYGLSLNSCFDWLGGRTAIGAELRTEDLVSGNLGEPLSRPRHISGTDRDYTLGLCRTNMSGHLEHNLLLRDLTLSAGLVAIKDTWSDMHWTVCPGADISYRPSSHWTLHASMNSSLRMPTFTEMYYRLQGYSANPHLKPEEVRAIETGVTGRMSSVEGSLTLWHHHGRNMIDWLMDTRQGDGAQWQSVNHTRINSIGTELTTKLNTAALMPWQHVLQTVNVSYSYIHQDKDLEEGFVSQYALEYLRHKLVANAQLHLTSHLCLSLNLRWQDRVGKYTNFEGKVCDYAPYCLVDSRLTFKGLKSCIFYLEANNLLNRSYVDYGHVPQPGMWITVGSNVGL